jgi:hypothetical protein
LGIFILGLPSSKFGLYPIDSAWAYGAERENYVWSGATPPPSDANTVGGNFYGGSDSTLLNLDEVRYALMLRYAALVGNGIVRIGDAGKTKKGAEFSAPSYYHNNLISGRKF